MGPARAGTLFLRRNAQARQEWRNKQNIGEIVCLHADLDFKNIEADRKTIEAAVKRLPLQPQLIVFSGHGLHCYWHFNRALPATPENVARVERALRRLAVILASDPAVCEVARLMRLPGTHNTKNGEWTMVRLVQRRAPGGYWLDEIEQWLAEATPVLQRRADPKTKTNGGDRNPWLDFAMAHRGPIDVDQRIAEMHYHGDENGIHKTQLSVTAALLTRGWPIEDVVAQVLKATVEAAGPEGRGWDWKEEEREIRKMCRKWREKHPCIVFIEEPPSFAYHGDS
jgi:hypothetical protein